MKAPVVQIQARLGSTRLPGKVFYPIGSRRVLEWVVERCTSASSTEGVVLAIGDRPENEALREWCTRNGLSCTLGPEDDLLERHILAADDANSDPVVRVTGDCPFLPPGEIDRLITRHESNEAKYTTNATHEMPIGTAVDVIDRDVLDRLRERGESHPVRLLREKPDEWAVEFSPNERLVRLKNAHIAVDTPEDYWRLTDAVDAVGDDPLAVANWVSQR